MTDLADIQTSAEALQEARTLLAAMKREAKLYEDKGHDVSGLIELTERVDQLIAGLVRRGTN